MFLDRIELTPVQDDGSTAICTIIFPIIEIDQGRFGWFDDGFGYQPHDIVQSSKKQVMVWRRPSKRVRWRRSGPSRPLLLGQLRFIDAATSTSTIKVTCSSTDAHLALKRDEEHKRTKSTSTWRPIGGVR